MTHAERIARIETLVEQMASDQKEIKADVKSLTLSRARVIGFKDYFVLGVSLVVAAFSLLLNFAKVKSLGG